MIRFGMPTLVENRTLSENVSLCGRLGLGFLELNMNFPEYGVRALEDTEALVREAEREGIFYTVHLDENLDPAEFNPLVREAWLETVRRTVLAAKRLLPLRDRFGDPARPLVLNMHLAHGIHITLPDRKVRMYERDFGVCLDAWTRFRDLCGEWIGEDGIRIAVENTDGYTDCEVRVLETLLESPVFGLTWDVGHSWAAGGGDEAFLLAHRDRLIHFHVHDAKRTPPANHLALGDGELPLEDRLRTARERDALCVLETKTAQALSRSVARIRELGWGG